MGSLIAWAYLATLLNCEQSAFQSIAPRDRCVPKRTKQTYVVCVVDEAGRGVAGAQVTAVRQQMGEGYGDVGFFDDKLGTRITDATGRATFPVPPVTGGFLWSAKELSRGATATYARWPEQAAGGDDVIVVGPPRTITLRTKLRACDGTASIGVYNVEGTDQGSGAFSFELGPGQYQYVVRVCADGHDASRTLGFTAADATNGVIDVD